MKLVQREASRKSGTSDGVRVCRSGGVGRGIYPREKGVTSLDAGVKPEFCCDVPSYKRYRFR